MENLTDEEDVEYISNFQNIIPQHITTQKYCSLLKDHKINFHSIPKQFLNEEICYYAILYREAHLHQIPKCYKTKAMYEICVMNFHEFGAIPRKDRTYELCLKAIDYTGANIRNIPKKFLTKEIYELLLENPGRYFHLLPKKYKTDDICEKALDHSCGNILFTPKKYLTENVCIELIKKYVYAFNYFHDDLITHEMCIIALNKPYIRFNIDDIPQRLFSKELCSLILKNLQEDKLTNDPEYVNQRCAISLSGQEINTTYLL
jgi:hypothetical protein